jgi:cysteine-rich repeat protein
MDLFAREVPSMKSSGLCIIVFEILFGFACSRSGLNGSQARPDGSPAQEQDALGAATGGAVETDASGTGGSIASGGMRSAGGAAGTSSNSTTEVIPGPGGIPATVGATAGSGGRGGTLGSAGGSPAICLGSTPIGCAPYAPEACGDGINNQSGIEECDDGNVLPGDGCNGNCRVEPHWACPRAGPCTSMVFCGDGIVGPGEECDDGNAHSGDGCSSVCTLEDFCPLPGQPMLACLRPTVCGNGHLDPGELCDDGNWVDGDGCSSDCKTIRPGCTCIPGRPCTCVVFICGNSKIEGAEQCDDGNTIAGDGCSPTCQLEPGYPCPASYPDCIPVCGDGKAQPQFGEECDDGASNLTTTDPAAAYDRCLANCKRSAHCGDGIVNGPEQCDGWANSGSHLTCNPDCRFTPGCGDGILQLPEQCDDGPLYNTGDYAGCTPRCTLAPHCGDGIKNGPEECDDGILDGSYGGCTPQCKLGPHCGDGIVNGPEQCDHGSTNGKDGCCTAQCKYVICEQR